MNKSVVIYEQNTLFLSGPEGDYTYEVRSNSTALIHEEVKSFIKEKSKSSFLHAPDFIHINAGLRHLVIPSAVYDPSLLGAYDERMYGSLPDAFILQTVQNKALQVQLIQAQPSWLQSLIDSSFSEQSYHIAHNLLLKDAPLTDALYIRIFCFNTQCYLSIQEPKKLWYSDFITMQSIDDIVFTLLNVTSQNNLAFTAGKITVGGIHPTFNPEAIISDLNRLEALNSMEKTMFSMNELLDSIQ